MLYRLVSSLCSSLTEGHTLVFSAEGHVSTEKKLLKLGLKKSFMDLFRMFFYVEKVRGKKCHGFDGNICEVTYSNITFSFTTLNLASPHF